MHNYEPDFTTNQHSPIIKGTIVVRCDNNDTSSQPGTTRGDMFATVIFHKGRNAYYVDGASASQWRPVTTLELNAYDDGIRNVFDIEDNYEPEGDSLEQYIT